MVIMYTLNCKSLRKDSKQKDLLFFLQSRKPPRLVSDDEEMYNFVRQLCRYSQTFISLTICFVVVKF